MDSFEISKIFTAIFLVVVFVIGIDKISDVIFQVDKPTTPGYTIEVEQAASTLATEEKIDIASLLAMGDIAHGEKQFKKCKACHSIKQGGGNKIGPKLWNVMFRQVGAVNDYKYSKALLNYDKSWSFEELNGYLLKPSKWIKGTKMAFAGLRKEKDRASVIKYLNQNSDNPKQLP